MPPVNSDNGTGLLNNGTWPSKKFDHLRPALCAFLDILGFTDHIQRAYREDRADAILSEIRQSLDQATRRISDIQKHYPMAVKFFTDNLVIAYGYRTRGVAAQLRHLCDLISDYQLSMTCKGHLIRGGVSIGTLAVDDRIVFGDSLIKAHDLESQSAVFPRIVLDPALYPQLLELSETDIAHERYTWNGLLKRDADGLVFIDYLTALYETDTANMCLQLNTTLLEAHKSQIEQRLKETQDNTKIWAKYQWAATYHNAFCEERDLPRFKIGFLALP